MDEIRQSDAMDFIKSLEDKSVDLIITDPPYESLEKHRRSGTTTRLKVSQASSNEWFEIFPNSKFPELFQEFYRILKDDTHFYLFCDSETMFVAKPIAESCGFKFWKPIVWDKVSIGMGYHYRSRYEFILFFEKGKRKLQSMSIPDILASKRIYNGYPAEKPVDIMEILVGQSSQPNEIVLDPFCGSGSAGVAAVTLERKFLGCDTKEEAIVLTKKRINEIKEIA